MQLSQHETLLDGHCDAVFKATNCCALLCTELEATKGAIAKLNASDEVQEKLIRRRIQAEERRLTADTHLRLEVVGELVMWQCPYIKKKAIEPAKASPFFVLVIAVHVPGQPPTMFFLWECMA